METPFPPALEAPRRALAVGAHPDDVEYFAGAAVAALAACGAEVSLVICTDGARGGHESGGLVERRRREATESAQLLGMVAPLFLGVCDGELVVDDRVREPLAREIRRRRPEVLLTHDPTTFWKRVGSVDRLGHSDHRATGTATLDAINPRAALGAFFPDHRAAGLKPWFVREIWLFDTAEPDHFVDVRPHRARKRAALACHASQNPGMLAVEADRHEDSYTARAGFPAEAFRRVRIF